VEQSESGNAQQDKTPECVHHLQQVGQQTLGIVENPVSQKSTEHDNGAVNQKNAPVRQRILCKIPV
jgi:Mrp family chromosome partitioning ATPase